MLTDRIPKISVVIPTYNRAYTIQNAVRSIVDQTFKEWEMVVVDDGSTDGTKRIVESFAHPRIRFIELPHCGFVSKVRNAGNKEARGELIVVQDSDDQSFPDRLEEIWNCYERTQADLIYHGMYARFFDPYHNAITRLHKPAQLFSKERLLTEQYIPGQVAYKRSTVLEIPYDERIVCCDDYQLLLEFCLSGKKFEPIYKQLYDYVDTPDSINVNGELRGDRKRDVQVILSILKDKYKVEKSATLVKNTVSGELISREIIQ